jgi:hypothetical protein
MKIFCIFFVGCLGITGCQWSKPQSKAQEAAQPSLPQKAIFIPGVGQVNFPATISDTDIAAAIKQNYQKWTGKPLPEQQAADGDPRAVGESLPAGSAAAATQAARRDIGLLSWLRTFGWKRTPLPDAMVNLPFWGVGFDSVISAENLSDETVGQVMDAFDAAQDGNDLRRRLDNVPISGRTKATLWNLRAGSVCQAMAVTPVDFVPDELNREAYFDAVSKCWNESKDKPAMQVEAAERLFTLNATQIADLRKELDAARADLGAETSLAADAGRRANDEHAARITQAGRAGKLASDIYSDLSARNQGTASALQAQIGALQARLFALSQQYSSLQSQYEALQRQLLAPRPSLPRAFACEPTGGGTLACIPGP